MRHAEALAALAGNDHLGLILDRRGRQGGRLRLSRMIFRGDVALGGANSAVSAYLVESVDGRRLPPIIGSRSQPTHIRLMDHFYLPVMRDPVVTAAMFDLISDLYEGLANVSVNVATARHLLEAVLEGATADATLLDFGCGTGLATEALHEMGVGGTLVGTDLSKRMLRLAKSRGERVLTIDQWRQSHHQFDGAIACFVMHYGVSEGDLGHIARCLKPGAKFAANFFKSTMTDVAWLKDVMECAGMRFEHDAQVPSRTRGANPILVFENPPR